MFERVLLLGALVGVMAAAGCERPKTDESPAASSSLDRGRVSLPTPLIRDPLAMRSQGQTWFSELDLGEVATLANSREVGPGWTVEVPSPEVVSMENGTATTKGRSLPAAIMTARYRIWNRDAGQKLKVCVIFAAIHDAEFAMWREVAHFGCDDLNGVAGWRRDEAFVLEPGSSPPSSAGSGAASPAAPSASANGAGPPAAGVGGDSCEVAIERHKAVRGESDAAATAKISALLNKGSYLAACKTPASTKVSICAAMLDGQTVGVTVTTAPSDTAVSHCIEQRIRAMQFPPSRGLVIERTKFE